MLELSKFLAEQVDDLFINGFRLDPQKHAEIIKSCFCWIQNTLYITCFEKPKLVLSFHATYWRIKIKRINNLKAIIWGTVIKDEYQALKKGTKK